MGMMNWLRARGRWDLTLLGHLSLLFEITLVAYNNDGEVVLVLDPEYELLEGLDLFKRLPRCDGVDQ